MSKCGKCRNKTCACSLISDNKSTLVAGVGTAFSPYQVRPKIPADYRPVGFISRMNTHQAITLNTDTLITFDSNRLTGIDTTMWDAFVPTRLTIPSSGLYLIGGSAAIAGSAAAQVWNVWIVKNGLTTTPLAKKTATVSSGSVLVPLYGSMMTLTRLTAGDYLQLYVRSNLSLNALSSFAHLWANWMGV